MLGLRLSHLLLFGSLFVQLSCVMVIDGRDAPFIGRSLFHTIDEVGEILWRIYELQISHVLLQNFE